MISRPGIYQVSFSGAFTSDAGTSIPTNLLVSLQQDGTAVTGATARHTFAATGEVSELSFSVPFQVTAALATISIVSGDTGFTAAELTLTVIRLGD